MVVGRQSCRAGTVKASTTAITQPEAITTMTGHGLSSAGGSAGIAGDLSDIETNVSDYRGFPETS